MVTNLEQFRNLMAMATADGKLGEAELRLLSDRVVQWGISNEQFEVALQEVLAGKSQLTIPVDRQEREAMLKGLIRMMAADGRLTDAENQLFALAAATMRISAVEVSQLIDAVLGEDGLAEDGLAER